MPVAMPTARVLFLVAACCVITLSTAPSWAMQAKRGAEVTYENAIIPMTIRAETGYLWGQSRELVYEKNYGKVSELIWDLKNIFMVGGVVSAEPLEWLQVHLGAWSKVNEGDGKMNDYDWKAVGQEDFPDWSDWSQSDVDLEVGWILDANVQARFLEWKGLGLWAMVGFKHQNWRWSDRGGKFIYSEWGGLRNVTGTFDDDQNGITYEQWFYTPYTGLTVTYDRDSLHLTAYATGTLWAWANDEDQHHLRNLVVNSRVYNIDYVAAGIQASYDLSKHWFVGAAFDYQHYLTEKGTGKWDFGDVVISYDKGNGIEHYSHMVSFTLGYKF